MSFRNILASFLALFSVFTEFMLFKKWNSESDFYKELDQSYKYVYWLAAIGLSLLHLRFNYSFSRDFIDEFCRLALSRQSNQNDPNNNALNLFQGQHIPGRQPVNYVNHLHANVDYNLSFSLLAQLFNRHGLMAPNSPPLPGAAAGNRHCNEYSAEMKAYLEQMRQQRESNTTRIEKLKIPDSEWVEYQCTILLQVPNIPVILNRQIYNLDSLLRINVDHSGGRQDPRRNGIFFLSDIQPGSDVQNAIEAIIAKYLQIELADKKANLALNCFRKGNYVLSKFLLSKAIDIYESYEGKNHIGERLAMYYYNLSSSLDHLREKQEAIKFCEKSLVLKQALFGPNNEATLRTKIKLEVLQNKLLADATLQSQPNFSTLSP